MALGEPDNAARFASGELALDFVNSATGRSRASRWEDSLTDAFATLTWLRQREAVDEEGFRTLLRLAATDDAAAQAFMTDVTALRDTLSTVFRAAVSEDAPLERGLGRRSSVWEASSPARTAPSAWSGAPRASRSRATRRAPGCSGRCGRSCAPRRRCSPPSA